MIDLAREIMQTLGHNKLRTALTGVAVTWGIFMLIVLLSMARGVTNAFDYNMLSRNTAMIRVWGGKTSTPYHGNREGRYIEFDDSDLKIVPEENQNYVDGIRSVISGGGKLSTPKGEVSQTYSGVYPSEFTPSRHGDINEGRFINDRDMKTRAKVIVIPQYYAKQLFPPEGKDALGGRVDCNGLSFKVVGVYESRWNKSAYIPFTTARMLSSNQNKLGNLSVELKNVTTEADGTNAESGIRETLSKTHNFDPKDDNAIYISNDFNNALTGKAAMGILDTCVWVLGILTLLTGIVGISNIMFVTVKERTHEIGIRRAIGAKPLKILTQVIAESVSITVLFGYIGIVLGMVVTQLLTFVIDDGDMLRNPTVSLAIAFEVTLVLIVAGALAGLFPALKALKVKPVEALRDE